MHHVYKVVDLSTGATEPSEYQVEAGSPEAAGSQIVGIPLIRSGAKKDLMAKVYWQVPGHPTNMVRLYNKGDGDRRHGD